MRKLTLIACACAVVAAPAIAQEREGDTERPRARAMVFGLPSPNRAVLGISTTSGGAADTLGVLVESVTPEGPAARAGISEGARILAVNDVSLRLSPADARESDMQGVPRRRLQRELARVQPGDEVRLRIRQDGREREVRVRTVAASELRGERPVRVEVVRPDPDRPMLGISVGGTATARDTLGLFVSSVISGGPAEKAGIIEGVRIAAINGVNLRVPREDAGDRSIAATMSARFTRELRKAKPGESVQLRVWSDGRYRDVRVTTVAASELDVGERFFPEGFEIRPGTMIRSIEPAIRHLEERARELQYRIPEVRVMPGQQVI